MEAHDTKLEMPSDGGATGLITAPFAPGESPFHIKGNGYRGHAEYVQEHIPGGMAAQREALVRIDPERGPAWADYLEQTFMASSWYDLYPMAMGGLACARVLQIPYLDFVYQRAAVQAALDIKGIHKFLLKFVSPKAIALRVPRLVSQYFDFLGIETKPEGDGAVSTVVEGLPVELAPWWVAMSSAYVTQGVVISGSPAPTVEAGPYVASGVRDGVQLCTAHVRIEFPSG